MNTLSNKTHALITADAAERCSYCMSPNLVRIHKPKIIKSLFFWIPLSHFLCHHCMNKQYKLKKFH